MIMDAAIALRTRDLALIFTMALTFMAPTEYAKKVSREDRREITFLPKSE